MITFGSIIGKPSPLYSCEIWCCRYPMSARTCLPRTSNRHITQWTTCWNTHSLRAKHRQHHWLRDLSMRWHPNNNDITASSQQFNIAWFSNWTHWYRQHGTPKKAHWNEFKWCQCLRPNLWGIIAARPINPIKKGLKRGATNGNTTKYTALRHTQL